MEEYDSLTTRRYGLTLIEVMVGMVIFSVSLGMVSGFVKAGVDQPFMVHSVESWVRFVEETSNAVLLISGPSQSLRVDKHHKSLTKLKKPGNLVSWNLEWASSKSFAGSIAEFSATSSHGKTYRWRVYRGNNDS